MIRTDRRTLIIGAAIIVVACSTALAVHLIGASKSADPGLVRLADRRVTPSTDEGTAPTIGQSVDDYKVVTERNVFRALVAEPRDSAVLDVPSEMPSPRGSDERSGPSEPPDPTRNLAMTGVVETNAGLMGLIKNVASGTSVYAGVGDTAFDLRVARIEAKRMTLARDDREYTLQMGAKEIPEAERASASRPSGAGEPSGAQGEGPPRRPGFGPPGGRFGSGDMGRRLEDAYRSGRISREQYDRARRYMSMRGRGGPSRRSGRGR
ncbi:MAG: hypothetical protein PVH68_08345 [Armatimonadota bacterium]|jgi:hypothetical protein